MSTYIGAVIVLFSIVLSAPIYILFQTRLFDKYFEIHLEENYNLDDLFPIKIKGKITPKVNYLEIPFESLSIEIKTKTIRGTIVDNIINLELINLSERRKLRYLIKKQYIKTIKPYVLEIIKNNKEYIKLIKISKKQKPHMKKIACGTCKHRMQCQISFNECNYERETRDAVLSDCIRTDTNKAYGLD